MFGGAKSQKPPCGDGTSSTYDMLIRLLDLSSFCKDNEGLNDKLKLTEEGWKELQEAVESLVPVRTLTTKLQESALTSVQTLGHWQLTINHDIVRANFYSTSSKC